MNEEKYTRNPGGSREVKSQEGKTEAGNGRLGRAYSEKLQSETSRSKSMKGKFSTGKGKSEGSKKLKRSGQGKRNGKKLGVTPPIPSPPPPGSVNFTGNEYAENNNASEDVRDAAGNIGILGLAAVQYKRTHRYRAAEPKHDWSNAKQGKYIGDTDPSTLRPGGFRSASGASSSASASSTEDATEGTTGHSNGNFKQASSEHEWSNSKEGYSGKMHRGKYSKEADVSVEDMEARGEYSSNAVSREWQRRSTQKKIMKRGSAGQSDAGGSFFETAAEKMEALAEQVSETVMSILKSPIAWILGIGTAVGLISATTTAPSMGMLLSGGNNVVVASSFTAEDEDIVAVEEDYQDLEDALRDQIDDIEDDYPGYDEYNFDLDTISHDEFELAALLTVLHESYTEEEVQETLKQILNGQYDLTLYGHTEIRTKTVTKWHWVTKSREVEKTGYRWEGGRLVSYTYTDWEEYSELESYEEEVEYEYKIMDVTLEGRSIDAYVEDMGLADDQMDRYWLLLETKGNKPDVFD